MRLILATWLSVMVFPACAADYACLIEPRQTLKLSAAVVGVVRSIEVDRGDVVKKGQLVARLDTDVEEAELEIGRLKASNDADIAGARAKLEAARLKLGRKLSLREKTYGSKAEIEDAQAEARVAEAQLQGALLARQQAGLETRRAEAVVRLREVLSPVDGVVTRRDLGPGEYSNEQSSILTLAQMDPLRVETYLPLALFGRVRVGDVAQVQPDPPVGGSYAAKVKVVDPVLDAASKTIGVRLELPNPGFKLPAGVHCHVSFADGS